MWRGTCRHNNLEPKGLNVSTFQAQNHLEGACFIGEDMKNWTWCTPVKGSEKFASMLLLRKTTYSIGRELDVRQVENKNMSQEKEHALPDLLQMEKM